MKALIEITVNCDYCETPNLITMPIQAQVTGINDGSARGTEVALLPFAVEIFKCRKCDNEIIICFPWLVVHKPK